MGFSDRTAMVRLLWSAVRRIPHGEELLRRRVAEINRRDASNADLIDTPEYSSTKRLNEEQLRELAHELRRIAKLPVGMPRPRGPRGGAPRRPEGGDPSAVTHIASQGELAYADYLFDLVGFAEQGRKAFVDRQTRGKGLTTHRTVEACVAPLERMLRARGWSVVERDRQKTWTPPPAAKENEHGNE